MMTDDTGLAIAAGNGDREAFRLLIERHYDGIHRLARRFTGRADDAEDVAQDVVVSLATRLKGYRGEAQFKTWLYRVVFNAVQDRHRKVSTRERIERDYVDVAALRAAGDTDRAEQAEWLNAALEQLKPDLRETALLLLSEEITHAEAAQIFDVKESTISWRMHEVRKALAEIARTEA